MKFRVAQVSAPRPREPVPLSPAESRCVPFCHRISIRPSLATCWADRVDACCRSLPETAHLRNPVCEPIFHMPSQRFPGKQQFGWTVGSPRRCPLGPPTCPSRVRSGHRVVRVWPLPARTSNGVAAAIEEEDNDLARPDHDAASGAAIAAGDGGQEGVPADKPTDSLQDCCRCPPRMSVGPATCRL